MTSKSALGYDWKLKEIDKRFYLALIQQYDCSEILARSLSSKNNLNLLNVQDYLEPKIKNLMPDPFSLLDMDKAVDRIIKAIKNNEKIAVFGDYDVDGATSVAIIYKFLSGIGIKPIIYIPDRIEEGYGPNTNAMIKLKQMNASVVITVDCGAVAFEPLKKAAEEGLDVIVIDHHIGAKEKPQSIAIINPNRLDETSKLTYLAAAGVSFLFVVAINKTLVARGFYSSIKEPNLMGLIDLVALGTVCDVVPLIELNRAFVSLGLQIMQKRGNASLNMLFDVAGVNEKPSIYHLGFILGPRINAGGRIGKASLGAELLTSSDEGRIREISVILNSLNQERKEIESKIEKDALDIVERQKLYEKPVIMLASKDWHQGVIGIVASRIKDKYNKPTILISINNENIGKASCRSIKGVDIGSGILLANSKGFLITGGGHAMAAGFSIEISKFDDFYSFLILHFTENVINATKDKSLYLDGAISLQGVNIDLYKQIEKAGPFGAANSEPCFSIQNVIITGFNVIKDSHLKVFLKCAESGANIVATAFRSINTPIGNFILNNKGKRINVAGSLSLNNWLGRESVEFRIVDLCLIE